MLIAVVLIAHFLPPERSAPSPDDVSTAHQLQRDGLGQRLELALTGRRPLLHSLSFLHTAWTWDHSERALALLVAAAILAALASYALFHELVQDDDLAFLAAVTYAVLPNKLELYHTGMYALLLAMQTVQMLAGLQFLRALRRGSRLALVTSLFAYCVGCLMSEVGLLLPVAAGAWAVALRRPRLSWACWFAVPGALFASLYLATADQVPAMGGVRTVQWERIPHNVAVAAPGFFFGRHIARAVIYGLIQLPHMEPAGLALALLLDTVLVFLAWRWLSRTRLPRVTPRMMWASAVALVAFLVPNILYVIEDRHTALADLGFAVLLLPIVAAIGRHVALPPAAFAALLIVAQGNGWNHVVACRINRAVLETVRERHSDVAAARAVIFDLASFTARIPYTWGDRQNNPLATYYGAQVFAPWGLSAMVRLAGGRGTVIASQQAVTRVEAGWEYVAWTKTPTRLVAPEEGTLVIDHTAVYGCGYERGNRRPCPVSGGTNR